MKKLCIGESIIDYKVGWLKRTNNESPDQFNCVDLVLREEDIIKLEKDIEDRKLPETEGFFFGDDTYNDEETYKKYYLKDDMAFIEAAKEAIHEGKIYGKMVN